jgi:hypothetical protein
MVVVEGKFRPHPNGKPVQQISAHKSADEIPSAGNKTGGGYKDIGFAWLAQSDGEDLPAHARSETEDTICAPPR